MLPRLEVFRRRSLEKKCSGGAPTKKKCSGGAPLKRSVRRGAHLKRSVRQRPVERIEGELERRSLKKKSSGSDPSKRSVQRGDPSKRSVRRCPVRRFEGACPDKRKLSGALRQKDAGPARLKLTLPPPCTGPVTMHVGAAAATASRVVTQALALPPPLHPALSERGSSASVAEQRSSNSDSPANTAERQTPDSSRATALATARRALSPAQLQPRASQSGSTARRHHHNATREGVMVARSRCNRVPLCPRQLPSQPPSEQPRPRARVVASRAPPASNAEARKDRASPWRVRRRQPTAVAPTGAVRRREASSRHATADAAAGPLVTAATRRRRGRAGSRSGSGPPAARPGDAAADDKETGREVARPHRALDRTGPARREREAAPSPPTRACGSAPFLHEPRRRRSGGASSRTHRWVLVTRCLD